MSYAQASVDLDSHLSKSDLNDWAEALITAVCEGDNMPDTPHSHDFDPCHGGNAHGQGAAMHSCRCYRRTKVESALADAFEQDQRLEPEFSQDVDSWSVGGRSGEIWPLKRILANTAEVKRAHQEAMGRLGLDFLENVGAADDMDLDKPDSEELTIEDGTETDHENEIHPKREDTTTP
ncbi:hypothetical protein DFH29DRAFT_994364 [Suillus ampliporus]|nr:hypothetical protein DFH29DRAFT_994364 [Suillus ampliporus]